MGTRTTFAFVLALGSLGVSAVARAGDPDPMLEKLTALEKRASADIEAKAEDPLVGDAIEAANLHKECAGKDALQERALAIVGGIAKVRIDSVAKLAILRLGEIGDLRGAKFIRGFLKPMDEGKVPVTLDAALDAAKKLPDSSLVEPLLQIVDASKNFAVAAKAITALGAFGAIKSKRERILVELAKTVQKAQPGGKGKYGGGGGGGEGAIGGSDGGSSGNDGDAGGDGAGGTASQGSSARWPALSAALPAALNQLTGTQAGSAEDWFGLVKQHKGKLSALFVNDGATPAKDAPK